MTDSVKYRVRFFFDYGAGGCLWADNDLTYAEFGVGPIDEAIATKTKKLSTVTLEQINVLDLKHSTYLNKEYPPDPSLWRQRECEDFNQSVDLLLKRLRMELGDDFEIIDKQPRYKEAADLEAYLKNSKQSRQ